MLCEMVRFQSAINRVFNSKPSLFWRYASSLPMFQSAINRVFNSKGNFPCFAPAHAGVSIRYQSRLQFKVQPGLGTRLVKFWFQSAINRVFNSKDKAIAVTLLEWMGFNPLSIASSIQRYCSLRIDYWKWRFQSAINRVFNSKTTKLPGMLIAFTFQSAINRVFNSKCKRLSSSPLRPSVSIRYQSRLQFKEGRVSCSWRLPKGFNPLSIASSIQRENDPRKDNILWGFNPLSIASSIQSS